MKKLLEILFSLVLLFSPGAWAGIAFVGGNAGNAPGCGAGGPCPEVHGGLHSTHPFLAIGWSVGTPANPITISADPNAPPWIKDLQLPAPQVPGGVPLQLLENLVVGPGPNWTDWHQTILTPGFEFIGAPLLIAGAEVILGDLMDLVGGDGINESVVFDGFDLAPGTPVTIIKDLSCALIGADCQTPGFIQVAQFPTTAAAPEPGSLLLLAAGLFGLAALRRRRL